SITSSTNMSKEDIQKAVDDAAKYAEEDKKRKEAVDAKNNGENLVFQCEKALTEFGDKVTADDKAAVQPKIDALKEALKSDNTDDIKAKTDELQKAFSEVATKVYQAAGAAAQAAQGAAEGGNDNNGGDNGNGSDFVDADFKDVE
ncbi:MAG: Hsp70 family protein, partial [Oscillospiraceae bacterium]